MIRWRRRLWWGYLAVLHAALLLMCWKTDILPRCGRRLGLLPPLPPAATAQDHYQRMVKFYDWMDGSVPQSSVLFLGDSLVQGLCVSAVTPDGVNYGIGGDTVGGLLHRLGHYRSLSRCRAVVLQVGVNDFSASSNAEIVRDYTRLLEAISLPVVVCGVLPVDERDRPLFAGYNTRIRELNHVLQQLCQTNRQRVFIDTTSRLTNETGQLASPYHVGDGIHLSPDGYQVWIYDLRQALEPMPHRVTE